MKLKTGVNPFGIRCELNLALSIAANVWEKHGKELVITSINDGKHSHNSSHYKGLAADLRTHYFRSNAEIQMVAKDLREALGYNPDYDVVVEKTHIHLEYDPKYRGAV